MQGNQGRTAPDSLHHISYGRSFKVLARFPEAETAAVNEFIERTPGAGVLDVRDGEVIVADCADRGVPA